MKELLRKYKEGSISVEEFDALAYRIERTPDDVIGSILAEDWNDCSQGGMPPGRKRRKISGILRKYSFWTGLAACLFLAVSAVLFMRLADYEAKLSLMASREVTVRSGNAGQSSVVLPDGTNVILNARSAITYSSDFCAGDRTVTMSGEGFFDVAKDHGRKFIVIAPDMEIIVHGTKFNVYAYPESEYSEMSLVEGSVSIGCKGSIIPVSPNEKVILSRKTGKFSVSRTDNELETSWMKDRIVFVHEPLSHVVEVLERRFGVQINCDSGISLSDRYTGTFKDCSLTDIIDVLRMHYGFSYRIKDNHIILTH
ncbi:MAG: FecR domain-containing protein [Bacteroidales bacterium]|nr:FecR domain-containing protein [Bacteroidales bacterium]